MANDARQFRLDLAAFAKLARDNADAVVRKTIIDIGTRIVERSPVGDGSLWKHLPPPGYVGGRFRANWQAAEGTAPRGDLPDIDPSGAASNERIAAAIPIKAAGKTFYLVNNLPYSIRLEDGWSSQAPSGMVSLAVVEFQGIVSAACREVNP